MATAIFTFPPNSTSCFDSVDLPADWDNRNERTISKIPSSESNAYARAGHDVVLRTRGQHHIQIWIARHKIANLAAQAEDPKQPVVHASTKIDDATAQELVGCVWPFDNCTDCS